MSKVEQKKMGVLGAWGGPQCGWSGEVRRKAGNEADEAGGVAGKGPRALGLSQAEVTDPALSLARVTA